jgi:hypothetical protein
MCWFANGRRRCSGFEPLLQDSYSLYTLK